MAEKKQPAEQPTEGEQLRKEMNRLRNEKRDVEIKFEISKLLYAELDYGRLLNLIIDKIMDILRAERGFIVTGEPDDFEIKVARNIEGDELSDEGRTVSRTVVHKVLSTGEPSFINDAQQDGMVSSRSIIDLGLRSILCVPLIIGDSPYGAIYIENRSMANCFMEKDLELLQDLAELSASSIRNALNFLELARTSGGSATSLGEDLRRDYDFSMIIGKSRRMVEVMEMAARVAPTDATVLITGDSGTGKELIARATYLNSQRKDSPFLTINCGALPSGLLESELFGHVKGSFTGAYASKVGRFEAANGGTIFLDEVGEMPPELQVKLLRVLQFGEFEKVGSYRLQRVDVRIIAATNKDLMAMVKRGEFREDLYYRMKIIEIHFPPLRDRPDDIPLLIDHFIVMYAKKLDKQIDDVDPQFLRLLQRYPYPGNIRELESIIHRAMILSENNQLSASDLPPEVLDSSTVTSADSGGLRKIIAVPRTNEELKEAKEEATSQAAAEVERAFLEAALEASGGNITKAAKKTGMNRSLFQRLVKKHDIQPKKK
ncbi:MAG: GAF domain-containing protein [Candidatus Glassbacteria bacterium]|nr:GAF domain-containing protein [Candidatus Glassbacteria bacterium]